MGLVQETQVAMGRYEHAARAAELTALDLAATVGRLADQLSEHGPLGPTADADLERARTRLAVARQRLVAAAESARASGARARDYVDRAFPS